MGSPRAQGFQQSQHRNRLLSSTQQRPHALIDLRHYRSKLGGRDHVGHSEVLVALSSIGLIGLTAIPAQAWASNSCGLWSATATYRHASGLPTSDVSVNVDSKNYWNAESQANFVPAASGQTEKVYMTAYTVTGAIYDGLWVAHGGCNSSGHSIGTVNVMLNRKYTDNYSSSARTSVMVHELGHAIGLSHTGGGNCSGQPIMYPYTSTRYFTCGHVTPQPGDIAGANFLL